MIGSIPISGTSAPFVQWLGHQIFTLETGVRFSYGVPLQFDKMVGFPSGQRDQTVNLTAQPSKVRILPQPPSKKQSTTLRCSFFNFSLNKIMLYIMHLLLLYMLEKYLLDLKNILPIREVILLNLKFEKL